MDERKNAEGYKDLTAYEAIKNTQIGRNNKDMGGYEISKGEIWEVEGNGYGTKLVVVLCCYEKYAATVMLQDQEPTSNAVPVRARDIMYADAGRLGWTFYDKMLDFVRTLSAEEDQELRQAIAAALEIPVDEAPLDSMAADANREIDGLQYEIAQLRKQVAAAKDAAQRYENEVAETTLRLEAARAEADVLRRELAAAEVIEREGHLPGQQEPVAQQGYIDVVELIEEHSLREDLAAARQEAQIYKDLYERLLDKALG